KEPIRSDVASCTNVGLSSGLPPSNAASKTLTVSQAFEQFLGDMEAALCIEKKSFLAPRIVAP
ncbi:MAG: hypothetical protein ABJ246_13940, partial [Paracoccaceae bacterium]